MSYNEINSRRRSKAEEMFLCLGCEEPAVIGPGPLGRWCKICAKSQSTESYMRPMAHSNDGNIRSEIGNRLRTDHGRMNLVDEETQGQTHEKERSAKKQKVETKAEMVYCSSCNKQKQPNDFDEVRKTCRACLSAHRLGRESDQNSFPGTRLLLESHPPSGNRSGFRRETPIIIPSPSVPDEDSKPEPKEYTVCQECRKRHQNCKHGNNVDLGERSRELLSPYPERLSLIVHLKIAEGQGSKNMGTRQAPEDRRHPSEETKPAENTKALDEELRNIAQEATMKALRSKLVEAKETEMTARLSLSRTRTQRAELCRRVEYVRKQEERDFSAVVKAQRLIDDVRRRLTKHE
ncbi:MAG: hypothetical protein M1830_006295, partial [Pleopsidium flavum]